MTDVKKKLMLVDDDRFVRDMISELLRTHGYEVLLAADGEEAFNLFRQNRDLDLIITDIHMPIMSGLLLTEKLRSEGHKIPIIILSSNNEIAIAIEAINLGADDYLMKGEDISETICVSIKRVFEKYQLLEHNRELVENLAARNLELEKANAKLFKYATRDPLTNLNNRRVFFEEFDKHVSLSLRYKHPLSVSFIDVDDFKLFNDTFGHMEGDRALKSVAEIIQSCARVSDVTARYGGEEFAVLMPNTEAQGAMSISERLREAVEGYAWKHRNITVSLGVTSREFNEGEHHDFTVDSLMLEADRAQYYSKENGKNISTHISSIE